MEITKISTEVEPPVPPDVSLEGFFEGVGPLWMQLAVLLLSLIEIPLVLFAWKTLNQESIGFNSMLKKSIQVLPMYILIGVLFGLLVILLSFAFIIPGIIAAVYYAFTFQIVILEPEGRGIRNIFNKSAALVKGNFRLIFILWILTLLSQSLGSPVLLIPFSVIVIIFQAFALTAAYFILTKENTAASQ